MKDNRVMWGAFILSLLLHMVLAGVLWRIPLSDDSELALAQARAEASEVEIYLLDDDDPEPTLPSRFTSVPERLAQEEAPENPDFLAMYNSQAADRLDGGDGNSPAAAEEWVAPQIAIREDSPSGSQGEQADSQPIPQAPEESSQGPSGDQGETGEEHSGEDEGELGQWALPADNPAPGEENTREDDDKEEETPDLEDWWGADSPTLLKEGEEGESGDRGFDFSQAERGSPSAGVSYYGQYSLNTYQWNFAPWLHKFGNQLHRHWIPPYAYSRLGMIHGMTSVRLVIAKNGTILEFDVLDTEGHQSLHEASEAALKAFAPYAPLPANFPEEHLVLTIGLYYPALR